MLGYDSRYGGLAVYNGVCYQGGLVVSCDDEAPLVAPDMLGPPQPYVEPSDMPAAVIQPRRGKPVPVWQPPLREPPIRPKPVWQPPIRIEPPPSPVTTSPPLATWGWRRRRPPVRRPWVDRRDKPKPLPVVAVTQAELCPIRGYVAREIPGANEYQNFRCTPGQPVVIDAGLQAVGRSEALARHGLSGLDGFAIGNIDVPTWLPLVGLGLVALIFLKRGRR